MTKPRRLMTEQLENRAMLAGNVQVWVDGGTLFVRGDDFGNAVAIQQLDTNRYAVIGYDNGAGHTRINGQNAPRAFSGVTNDINVDLRGGHDVFVIGNKRPTLQLLSDEVSNGRAGAIPANPFAVNNNTVNNDFVVVNGNLIVRTGDGADGVAVQARAGRGDRHAVIDVDTGNGNDRVTLQVASATDDVLVKTGHGNDRVRLNVVTAADLLLADLGSGNDTLIVNNVRANHAKFIGGDGNDLFRLTNPRVRHGLHVDGGSGDDRLNIAGGHANVLVAAMGSGHDAVAVTNFDAWDDAIIDMGSGNDGVVLDDVRVGDYLLVALGDGDDRAEARNVRVRHADIDGGAGNDTLVDRGGNQGTFRVRNFQRRI